MYNSSCGILFTTCTRQHLRTRSALNREHPFLPLLVFPLVLLTLGTSPPWGISHADKAMCHNQGKGRAVTFPSFHTLLYKHRHTAFTDCLQWECVFLFKYIYLFYYFSVLDRLKDQFGLATARNWVSTLLISRTVAGLERDDI